MMFTPFRFSICQHAPATAADAVSVFCTERGWRLFMLLVTSSLALGLPVFAQVNGSSGSSGVSAQVSPSQIRPGGFANFSVMVEGGDASDIQQPTLPEGVSLGSPGRSTSSDISIVNGRTTRRYTQSWQITSDKPGKYIIPPQEVQVNGRTRMTEPVEFLVVERGSAAASERSPYEPLLSIEAGKREFYVGEIVPLTANLYIHQDTLLRRVGLIELPKDSFAIQRFPLQAEESVTTVAKQPYRVLTYKSSMSALKPGKYKLGPATSEIIVDMPSQGNPLPHPFLMQSDPQKVRPASNDIDINVVPLPEEGKPDGFNGVVGDFQMNITAEPTNVAVGEPISVEITISGTGNFDAIVEPKMTDADKWRVYPSRRFNMTSPDSFDGGTAQQIGYSQVIIPQQQVTSVPSYEFSYFSPTENKYFTLHTTPIPLEVSPGKSMVSPSGEGMAGDVPKTPVIQPPDLEPTPQAKPDLTDILAYVPEKSTWLEARPQPWRSEAFILTSAIAGGVLVTLLLGKIGAVMVAANRNAADAPARALWKTLAHRDQSSAQFYSTVAHYIKEKNLHGAEITALLHKYDEANFSPDHSSDQQPVPTDERSQVMHTLRSAEAEKRA